MTMIKHSQRSLRKPCAKCGATGLYWYHDTTNGHATNWCDDGSPDCKQANLTGRQNWTLGTAYGQPHFCGPEKADRLAAWQQRQNEAQDQTKTAEEVAKVLETVTSATSTTDTDSHDVQLPGNGSAAEALVNAVKALAGGSLNEAEIRRIASEAIASEKDSMLTEMREKIKSLSLPTRVEIYEKASGETRELPGATHPVFPDVMAAVQAKVNVWLVGPAGTGKTYLANQVAQTLEVPFGFISLTATKPISDILGYRDATGSYHDTSFRRVYENGGVFLFDECDNGNANTLGCVNAALANGHMEFPDKLVTKHPDTYIIAAANTYGTGADRQYVGRMQLDAAFLDRFGAYIEMPVDEALETTLAYAECEDHSKVDSLLSTVRKLRKNASDQKLPLLFSPRCSINGARMLQAGWSMEQVTRLVIRKGISEQDWGKVQ